MCFCDFVLNDNREHHEYEAGFTANKILGNYFSIHMLA
jgi:hypothetical protein